MSELLKVERLDVHYGGIQAVRDVSFTLHEGEQATLIGANGAGKSSTVRAITGQIPAPGLPILPRSKSRSAIRR
jgi:branched-chain amino acid transport system ATP-binding protein